MICLAYLLLSSCAARATSTPAEANNDLNPTSNHLSTSLAASNLNSTAVCNMINSTSFNQYTNGGMLVCNYGGLPFQEDSMNLMNLTLHRPVSRSATSLDVAQDGAQTVV